MPLPFTLIYKTKQNNDKGRLYDAAPAAKKLYFNQRTTVLISNERVKQPHRGHLKYRIVNLIVYLSHVKRYTKNACYGYQKVVSLSR